MIKNRTINNEISNMKTDGLYFDCLVDDLAADTFSVTEFTLDNDLASNIFSRINDTIYALSNE